MSDDPRRAQQAAQAQARAARRPRPDRPTDAADASQPGPGSAGLGRRSLFAMLAGGAAVAAAGTYAILPRHGSSSLPVPTGQAVGPEYLAATLARQQAPTTPMPSDGRTLPNCIALPPGIQNPSDLDLVLAIDTTGSMGAVLNDVKFNLSKLVNNLRATGGSVRVGVVGYKDLCDREVIRALPLTPLDSGAEAVGAFINTLQASGGCDWPEKMDAALEAATAMAWRGSVRSSIVVIADAPAHPEDEPATLAIAEAFRSKIAGSLVSLVDTGSGAHPFMAAVPRSGGGQYVTYDGRILNSLFPAITGCHTVG